MNMITSSQPAIATDQGWFEAISTRDIQGVQALFDQGLEIRLQDENKRTILHYSAVLNEESLAHFGIYHGAQVNQADAWGLTPLHLAAFYGSTEVASLLLVSQGTDINGKTLDGMTPLMLSALGGHEKTAELLLQWGANDELFSSDGQRACHYATWLGHAQFCTLLAHYDRNIKLPSKQGFTIKQIDQFRLQSASGKTPLWSLEQHHEMGFRLVQNPEAETQEEFDSESILQTSSYEDGRTLEEMLVADYRENEKTFNSASHPANQDSKTPLQSMLSSNTFESFKLHLDTSSDTLNNPSLDSVDSFSTDSFDNEPLSNPLLDLPPPAPDLLGLNEKKEGALEFHTQDPNGSSSSYDRKQSMFQSSITSSAETKIDLPSSPLSFEEETRMSEQAQGLSLEPTSKISPPVTAYPGSGKLSLSKPSATQAIYQPTTSHAFRGLSGQYSSNLLEMMVDNLLYLMDIPFEYQRTMTGTVTPGTQTPTFTTFDRNGDVIVWVVLDYDPLSTEHVESWNQTLLWYQNNGFNYEINFLMSHMPSTNKGMDSMDVYQKALYIKEQL